MENDNFNKTRQQLEEEQYQAEMAEIKRQRTNRILVIICVVLGLAIAAVVTYYLINKSDKDSAQESGQVDENGKPLDEKDLRIRELEQQLELAKFQATLDSVDIQFQNFTEGQMQIIRNDSILEKYEAARSQLDVLMDQLKREQQKNRNNNAEIAKLKAQIATLQDICRDYLRQIDELTTKNIELTQENESLKEHNAQLDSQVRQTRRDNEKLNERMTLAEKLNVTGVNLTALNNKGKTEKKITKAKKLMVTFSIPQNVSTPPGEKTIYLRITSPEGQLLPGNVGTFDFEGASLPATARLNVDYANEEIGGLQMYWDVTTTLTPGEYLVELFADGYRLYSGRFNREK